MVESIDCSSLVRLAHPDGRLWNIRGKRLLAREEDQSLPRKAQKAREAARIEAQPTKLAVAASIILPEAAR
jgi:hypothetical protein